MVTLKKKWLELATLAIALIALFVAWQANMIGKSQITPKIILIDSKIVDEFPSAINFGGHFCFTVVEEGQRPRLICTVGLYCVHQFRIANLGGASTSIVDFEARISYLDQELFLKGNGESAASITEQGTNFIGSTVSLIPSKSSVHLANINSPDDFSPRFDLSELPIRIDNYSTVDVFSVANILSEKELSISPFTSSSERAPYPVSPIDVSYSFLFSSGERLEVPAIPCLYIAH
jgi:hypothetical protein